MTLYFGLKLEDLVFPYENAIQGGKHYVGPKNLLLLLESHLGLIGHPTNNEHLRIEQYRQALQRHLTRQKTVFYQKSFAADQLATAARLLALRDELLLVGWNFQTDLMTPLRLQVLAEMEADFASEQNEQELSAGYADRFVEVLRILEKRKTPITQIQLNEPLEILPSHFIRLFQQLEASGVQLKNAPETSIDESSDLGHLRAFLARQTRQGNQKVKSDGSLLIIRAKRETDAAVFLAKLFVHNPDFRPLCLIPEKNRALDNALIQEALPSLGILSASLARPSLQILKLVTAFLWRPIDPFKIMEFVSLSVKPLNDDLANLIANLMAQNPGLNSDNWRYSISRFFEELDERAQQDKTIQPKEIRKQYEFWFERNRYDSHQKVPRREVIEVFQYLQEWAFQLFDESGGKKSSLNVLSQQAKRVGELLDALPESENQLSHLELERIVRTIYEPSPVVFSDAEIGHLPYVHHSSAVIGPVNDLVWWNFTRNEQEHFFSRWYQAEYKYLESLGVSLQTPVGENALLLWQRPRAILQTQGRLLLLIPDKIDGSEVFTHPLYDELEAAFEHPEAITYHLESEEGKVVFEQFFTRPQRIALPYQQLGKPKPFIQIDRPERLNQQREHETFSSLDSLFYFPYQWIFRHKIKLRKSSILSIVKDVTLLGNLAHRFFELLFREEKVHLWSKDQVTQWIDNQTFPLLSKEGAVLLLYGREPEKIAFINKVKYSAWSLIAAMQSNNWQVKQAEMDLNGKFMGIPIKGKADLVLERGEELLVIDLKWRGAVRRESNIRNEEDIQLVTYARLLTSEDNWAHTCYFILESGKLIARTNQAFKELNAISPESDPIEVNQRIWQRMQATYQWRKAQIEKGQIEIRTQQTLGELEEEYENGVELLDLLEMKSNDAPFDDYRTLINLVE